MIRHTVPFSLRHPAGSVEERSFLDAALALASIDGVENFERLRQVSPKSAFGFSMEFANDLAYASDNEHPVHVAFVAERWVPEVADFQELDYTLL